MRYIKNDTDADIWRFKRITGHKGPLARTHPNYKGCPFNVTLEWETGKISNEPLNVIASNDPISCTIYAKDQGLLDTPGWKRFKHIAK